MKQLIWSRSGPTLNDLAASPLQQFFSRGASFATTFINPIRLENVGWKYFISYCVILVLEVVFVYFSFAQISG